MRRTVAKGRGASLAFAARDEAEENQRLTQPMSWGVHGVGIVGVAIAAVNTVDIVLSVLMIAAINVDADVGIECFNDGAVQQPTSILSLTIPPRGSYRNSAARPSIECSASKA